ncbi:hypothetical protein HA402_010836 [Bradysia odoriphaga]|nr:hypothetical protein HA402_010836 [Bradysia odoriphaga]
MKYLTVLTLTWIFSLLRAENCEIKNGTELHLECKSVNSKPSVVIKGEIVSCETNGSYDSDDILRDNITSIFIGACSFDDVFEGITWHQLKSLFVWNPLVTSLDAGFFRDLNHLEMLFLILNTEVVDFTGLEQLKWLGFNRNMNSTTMFPTLKNLKYLDLSNLPEIRHLPTFSEFNNLIVLSLIRNQFEELNADMFGGLTNLRSLFLQRNNIQRIEDGAFATLKNLKKLDLSHNRLNTLGEHSFEGLENLQYLSLKRNHIATININTFTTLPKLIQLGLSSQDGHLTTIDLNAFPQFIDLRTKTVIYTEESPELDDIEKGEMQWIRSIFPYDEEEVHLQLFRTSLNKNVDHRIDLDNLTLHYKDHQSPLIFGNLDLSDNRITRINIKFDNLP